MTEVPRASIVTCNRISLTTEAIIAEMAQLPPDVAENVAAAVAVSVTTVDSEGRRYRPDFGYSIPQEAEPEAVELPVGIA